MRILVYVFTTHGFDCCLFQKVKRPYKKKPKLDLDSIASTSSSFLSPTHSGLYDCLCFFQSVFYIIKFL